MTERSKTLGCCPACDSYGSLTLQHVRLVPDLKGYKIMLCARCHKTVTRYEDEVSKARKHVRSRK